MRRRKCVTHATVAADVADEAGELLLLTGGVGAAALSSSSDGDGDADGSGYGKSLCAGKDIQTAECRGEQCQIGKDGKCVYDNNRQPVGRSVGRSASQSATK